MRETGNETRLRKEDVLAALKACNKKKEVAIERRKESRMDRQTKNESGVIFPVHNIEDKNGCAQQDHTHTHTHTHTCKT